MELRKCFEMDWKHWPKLSIWCKQLARWLQYMEIRQWHRYIL